MLTISFGMYTFTFTFTANATVYSDTSGKWMETAVDKMTELGIMTSYNASYFYPNNYFPRYEVARSLCMMLKEINLADSPHPFTDVHYSSSYSKYVKWVYNNGVMNGTSSTTFSPNSYIRRQDMCVALYNLYFSRIGFSKGYAYYNKVTYK